MSKTVVRLALKFAFGDRKHFVLPFLAMVIAVMGMVVVFSVIRGFDKSLVDALSGFFPHVISSSPLDIDEVERYRMVLYETVAQTKNGFKGALVVGTSIEALRTRFKSYLRIGHLPRRGECLVGEEFAREYGLSVGDEITLYQANSPIHIQQRKFVVSGFVKSGLYHYDSRMVVLNVEDAEAFQSPFFAYYLDDPLKAEKLVARLHREGNDDVYSWMEMNATYAKALKVDKIFAMIITFFIVLLSGFGVSNSTLYSVLTRQRQIGILLSLGMKPSELRTLFILVPLIVSFVGAVIGSAAGNAVAELLKLVKIPLPEDVFLTDHLPVAMRVQDPLISSALVVLISTVFSLMPSSLALRVDPVEVLRGE